MKTPIETNQKFVFRLEDFIYLFLIIYIMPFGAFAYQVVRENSAKNSIVPIIFMTGLIGICITIPSLLIFLSYRRRLRDLYFVENESIIRERNGKEIFQIPFKEIVSVGVYNKRGTQGSIVFFTTSRSKNFTLYDSVYRFTNTPLAAFGFTRKKINLVKNRKTLLTTIYLVNPNLHFVD